jgi:hypothetical protein
MKHALKWAIYTGLLGVVVLTILDKMGKIHNDDAAALSVKGW